MKKSSQVIGLPLIGVKEGVECGVVKDIVADPQSKKIKSIIVHSSISEYDFRELSLDDVIGIGKDYVITQSIESAGKVNLSGTGITLLSIKCIASSGNVLGSIKDFEFEEKTGDIQSLLIDSDLEINGTAILSLSNNLMFVDYDEDGGVKSTISSLENEQKEYLLGGTVKADIKDKDGVVIIAKGTAVTDDVIRIAEEADVMIDLTLGVE